MRSKEGGKRVVYQDAQPINQRAPANTHINLTLERNERSSGGSAHCRLRELVVMPACPLPYCAL